MSDKNVQPRELTPAWSKTSLLDGVIEFHIYDLKQAHLNEVVTLEAAKKVEQTLDIVKDLQPNTHGVFDNQLKDHGEASLTHKDRVQSGVINEINKDDVLHLSTRQKKKTSREKLKTFEAEVIQLANSLKLKFPKISILKDQSKSEDEFAKIGRNYFFSNDEARRMYLLGHQFYQNYKKGVKHFSFSGMRSSPTQKKTILGIASYIYYFENLKILILTPDMKGSYFSKFKTLSLENKMKSSHADSVTYMTYKHHGLYFLEVSEIQKKLTLANKKINEKTLSAILKDYDIVFYDLPKLNDYKTLPEIYFQILRLVDNVTFSLSLKKDTFKEVAQMQEYFKNFNVKLNGCVVDNKNFSRGIL